MKSKVILVLCLAATAILWIKPSYSESELQQQVNRLEQQLFNLRQTIADQQQQILEQKAEIQNLRGNNEVLVHQVKQMQKQQQDIYADFNKRFREMQIYQPDAPQFAPNGQSQAIQPIAPVPSTNSTSTAPTMPDPFEPVDSSTDSLDSLPSAPAEGEEEIYQRALTLLRERQYRESIKDFQEILNRYPQSKYADNALYWIGESHYALKEFDHALNTFNRLLSTYPDSSKRPHALLKIGYVYYEIQDFGAAKAILEQVRDTYQNTDSARLAIQRLQKMHAQGL